MEGLEGSGSIGILPVLDQEFCKKLIPLAFPGLISGKSPTGKVRFFEIFKEQDSVHRGYFLGHIVEG